MDNTFLEFCHQFNESFSVAKAVQSYVESGCDVQISQQKAANDLNSSPNFKSVSGGGYESITSIFKKSTFYINPLPEERRGNFLLLGHRAIPYYDDSLKNDVLTLTDEFGEPLPTTVRELPWHIIKRYNLGAPFPAQVQPEGEDLASIYREVLDTTNLEDASLFPDIDDRAESKDLAYQVDLIMSERKLNVKAYRYQIPPDGLLEVQVESYMDGQFSIRPVEPAQEKLRSRTDSFHQELLEYMEHKNITDQRVKPLLTSFYIERRQFLENPGNHWVHVVLQSDKLGLRHPGINPRIVRRTVQNDSRSNMKEYFIQSEFADEIEAYGEAPEKLITDAFKAYNQGRREAEVFLWIIEEIGEPCQEPLLEFLKSDAEEQVVFAVTALETVWTDDLEKPLKFIASDERRSEATRNGAMYLLVNLGSEEARNYTSRMVQNSQLTRENISSPDDLFETFVQTPEARAELLDREEPEQDSLLKEIIKIDDPRIVHVGASLVYSSRKERREIGREALMRSGVPLARTFFHDLRELPLKPLSRLSGTPLVQGEQYHADDAGKIKCVQMSNYGADGTFIILLEADVQSIDHLFLVECCEVRGILDAHYVTAEPEASVPEKFKNNTGRSEADEPFEVNTEYARQIAISSESRALKQFHQLPDAFKTGKILFYLPGGKPGAIASFEEFFEHDATVRDEDVYSFCRGETLSSMAHYLPLCAFDRHDPGEPVQEDQPTNLCPSFRERLANRFRRIGYLLYLNDHTDLARVSSNAVKRVLRNEKNMEPLLKALHENLVEYRRSMDMDHGAFPDVPGDFSDHLT